MRTLLGALGQQVSGKLPHCQALVSPQLPKEMPRQFTDFTRFRKFLYTNSTPPRP